jgi:hypothetical protein
MGSPSAPRTGPRRGPARTRRRLLALLLLSLLGTPVGGCGDGPGGGGGGGGAVPGAAGGTPVRRIGPWVFAGTDREIGIGLGQAFRDAIRARLARRAAGTRDEASVALAQETKAFAPAALLEELEGVAEGAGVAARALYEAEASVEVSRWFGGSGGWRAGLASPPGDTPFVVGALVGDEPLVVVERRPAGRPATLVVGRPGEIGALGGVRVDGLVVVAVDVDVPPEARTLRAAPSSWQTRIALERATSADDAAARFAPGCGHRLLVADGANRRVVRILSLAGDPERRVAPSAWAFAATASDPVDPAAVAQETYLGAFPSRPGALDAAAVAKAGCPPGALVTVVRFAGEGIRFEGSPDAAVWSTPR